jgi:opacity protein-like surface antigen
MKKLLIGAAAAAALLAPAVASADTNAVVGVQYGNTDFEVDDFDRYGISGAFSHDFSGGTFLQMDGEHQRVDAGGVDISDGYGALHYGTRNDQYAFGGFLSFDDLFSASGTGVGVEGQWYMNSLVLGGSLGYVDYSGEATALSAQVDGIYFFTPNFSVNALVAQTEGDDGLDTDWTSYGAGAEYRFHGPVSVSANYRQDEFDGSETDTWTVGLTFDLGTGSLQERQTQGPSLQGARNLSRALDGIIT